jgi:hypothetical protein
MSVCDVLRPALLLWMCQQVTHDLRRQTRELRVSDNVSGTSLASASLVGASRLLGLPINSDRKRFLAQGVHRRVFTGEARARCAPRGAKRYAFYERVYAFYMRFAKIGAPLPG